MYEAAPPAPLLKDPNRTVLDRHSTIWTVSVRRIEPIRRHEASGSVAAHGVQWRIDEGRVDGACDDAQTFRGPEQYVQTLIETVGVRDRWTRMEA
jgi:hypothetical protein